VKKPKPQLMWACVGIDGFISCVRRDRSLVAEMVSEWSIRRVEVRVVARKRKRRKP
jgi:hypothetical protein